MGGEFNLLWCAGARAGARFCFSPEVEARYGYGVNVYAGSGWGTEGYLRRIHNEMRYRKRLFAYPLSGAQRALVRRKIDALRLEFAEDVVHRTAQRKPLPMDVLRRHASLDPLSLLLLPIHAGQIVAKRIRD